MLLSRTNICKKYSLHASIKRASCASEAGGMAGLIKARLAYPSEAWCLTHRTTSPVHTSTAADIFENGRSVVQSSNFAGMHFAGFGHEPDAPRHGAAILTMRQPDANSHRIILPLTRATEGRVNR
jgi:hypothetical protein